MICPSGIQKHPTSDYAVYVLGTGVSDDPNIVLI